MVDTNLDEKRENRGGDTISSKPPHFHCRAKKKIPQQFQ